MQLRANLVSRRLVLLRSVPDTQNMAIQLASRRCQSGRQSNPYYDYNWSAPTRMFEDGGLLETLAPFGADGPSGALRL